MKEVFEVTENHIKLLQRMYFRYDDYCEFGAPAVDCKRPYGNSYVYGDIAEILGIEPEIIDEDYDEADFSEEQLRYMDQIHQEMTDVLQIFTRLLSISPGKYVQTNYYEWERFE